MKDEVVVIGAGGHAKVCVELLQAAGHRVAYCVGNVDSPDYCVGVPVLKGDENLETLRQEGYQRIFVAIGSNETRVRLASLALEQGYQLVNAISPHATISMTARVGVGVAIMAGAVINAEASISDLAIINTGATVDHDCEIRTGVHIAPQCCLAGNVIVGRMSFLGIGCKVIPEITIGDEVTVGAGGVVVVNLPNRTTAVGVPVRIIRQLSDV
jgi:UDP-perosamine 4-acetyltransferase